MDFARELIYIRKVERQITKDGKGGATAVEAAESRGKACGPKRDCVCTGWRHDSGNGTGGKVHASTMAMDSARQT